MSAETQPTPAPVADPVPAAPGGQALAPVAGLTDREIRAIRRENQTLRHERDTLRQAATDTQTAAQAEADKLAQEQGKYKELADRHKAEAETARQALQTERRQIAMERAAISAARVARFAAPEALPRLIRPDLVQFDADGQPTNLDELLADLARDFPGLLLPDPAAVPAVPAVPTTPAPIVPAGAPTNAARSEAQRPIFDLRNIPQLGTGVFKTRPGG